MDFPLCLYFISKLLLCFRFFSLKQTSQCPRVVSRVTSSLCLSHSDTFLIKVTMPLQVNTPVIHSIGGVSGRRGDTFMELKKNPLSRMYSIEIMRMQNLSLLVSLSLSLFWKNPSMKKRGQGLDYSLQTDTQSKQLCDPLLGRNPPVEKCWNRTWLWLGLRQSGSDRGQRSEVTQETRMMRRRYVEPWRHKKKVK